MSTNKIGFNNFKAFGEKMQTFSKKPITLVYGPNSIGKSSLLHMMAYRNQILEGSFSPDEISAGDTISLNGFASFVHKKDIKNTITLILETEYEQVKIEIQIAQIVCENNKKIVKDILIKYLFDDEVLIEASYISNQGYNIKLSLYHPTIIEKLEKIKNNNEWNDDAFNTALGDNEYIDFLLSTEDDFSFLKDKFHESYMSEDDRYDNYVEDLIRDALDRPMKWTQKDEELQITIAQMKDDRPSLFDGLDVKEIVKANINGTTPPKKKIIDTGHTDISMEGMIFDDDTVLSLKVLLQQYAVDLAKYMNQSAYTVSYNKSNFEYIGPLRFYPERNDGYKEIKNNELVNSQNFWSLLIQYPQIVDQLNSWLSNEKLNTPYKIQYQTMYDLSNLFKLNKKSYSKEEIEKYASNKKEIAFLDTRSNTLVHHREMGLGVTQILPIIGTTILNKNFTIAIEQPELHLHPRIQAEIADEFIRSYKENENEFLIETHSEHLLLRIMKRMRYTAEDKKDRDKTLDLTPDDVCLLYVDNNGKTTYINELELDDDGSLLDPWPNGFFEEGHSERFE